MEYEQELAHCMDKDGLMSTDGATGTKDQQGRKRKLRKRDEHEDERIECGEENNEVEQSVLHTAGESGEVD